MKKESKWYKSKQMWYILILGILAISFQQMYYYESAKANAQEEMTLVFCEMSNTELDLINTMQPVYIEKQCDDFKAAFNETKGEAMCNIFKQALEQLPEKFNCEDYIL